MWKYVFGGAVVVAIVGFELAYQLDKTFNSDAPADLSYGQLEIEEDFDGRDRFVDDGGFHSGVGDDIFSVQKAARNVGC